MRGDVPLVGVDSLEPNEPHFHLVEPPSFTQCRSAASAIGRPAKERRVSFPRGPPACQTARGTTRSFGERRNDQRNYEGADKNTQKNEFLGNPVRRVYCGAQLHENLVGSLKIAGIPNVNADRRGRPSGQGAARSIALNPGLRQRVDCGVSELGVIRFVNLHSAVTNVRPLDHPISPRRRWISLPEPSIVRFAVSLLIPRMAQSCRTRPVGVNRRC
jgi:hypothetical protein